ncbi:AAA family ATPase [Oceanivirga miroungae]|uniref:Uncharacterized protein n=1 Tax=Oceanivirga miroungae TaxID=1130046 RepID=A0A6I8M6Z7_9FUSO|nr:AAA family ATPase [Oceanivirga miroungae]VWL85267.1 hypothetical protein OMES3154_00550 [Oceanivirga miroungae]
MVIMNIKLDNIYSFKNFELNFSYPKKIVNSTIEYEYLSDKPNFRYKRVNILIGTNATGKTTFGKAIINIFNFINKRDLLFLDKFHSNKNNPLKFSIEFVNATDLDYLYKLEGEYMGDEKVFINIFKSKINKTDTYEKCRIKYKKISNDTLTYTENLKKIKIDGWFFTFSEDDFLNNIDIKMFNNILKTLDNNIEKVYALNQIDKAYAIKFSDRQVIVQNGKVVDNSTLSSGTKSGINISALISMIYKDYTGLYYCDEKFSYINSEIEISVLALMIQLLKKNTQLFFTTHNLDILDMNLPVHTFNFFKKEKIITVIHPENFIKKNNVSLKNAVLNDVFDFSPNLNLIDELEEELKNEKQ